MNSNSVIKEEWKQISRCPEYSVSDYGRVRRDKNGFEPHLNTLRRGYERVKLWNEDDFKHYYFYRHELVTEAFLPKPEGNWVLCHKNGNLIDNRVTNLEWLKLEEKNTSKMAVKKT